MNSFSQLAVLLVLAVLLLLSLNVVDASASWSYVLGETSGPDNWATEFPEYCGGMKQSPINIVTADVVNKDIGDFTLVGFGKDDVPTGAAMTVENNGHTVEVEITSGDYFVSEGGLSGDSVYKAGQFHFHWGTNSNVGSEHTVDGKKYPAEMHIVCYDQKYTGIGEAAGNPDGLTVLGFLIDVQAEDNTAFASIFDASSQIQFEGDHADLDSPLVFGNMLPSDLTSFYRYSGSLTTPTCNEVVVWNVFTSPILLSEAQILQFRSLYSNELGSAENTTFGNLFRPVQALNGRSVYLNDASAASFFSRVSISSMLTILVASLLLK